MVSMSETAVLSFFVAAAGVVGSFAVAQSQVRDLREQVKTLVSKEVLDARLAGLEQSVTNMTNAVQGLTSRIDTLIREAHHK